MFLYIGARELNAATPSAKRDIFILDDFAANDEGNGNPSPAEALLKRWVPETPGSDDIRGFEWGILWNQVKTLPQSRHVSANAVSRQRAELAQSP